MSEPDETMQEKLKALSRPLKKPSLWLILVLSAFAYQNCSPMVGRSNLAQVDLSSTASSINFVGSDLSVVGKELFPLGINMSSLGSNLELSNLPPGAIWTAPYFRWLPQKGQSGDYTVDVTGSSLITEMSIHINAVTSGELIAGPPTTYQDGDVGYVFIHGAGYGDLCTHQNLLQEYWGTSPEIIAPDASNRLLACYDGHLSVTNTAPQVAEQIVNAHCGLYNKCIIITHSMGGLVAEYMFDHARDATPADKNPLYFGYRKVFEQARAKTLFVISLASAAGGSKVANILEHPDQYSFAQQIAGDFAQLMGANNNGYYDLDVQYASDVLAPITADPGVPFFMVAGYSPMRVYESSGYIANVALDIINQNDPRVFNGNGKLAWLDSIVQMRARSDGLVSFRSSCGIADDQSDGPGYRASLATQLSYCVNSPKKPDHYLWFIINLNHYLLSIDPRECQSASNPCDSIFVDSTGHLFVNPAFHGQSAVRVIRTLLTQSKSKIL